MNASGNRSLAICDQCGLAFPHNTLSVQTRNDQTTSLRVCRSCLDEDFKYFNPDLAYPDPITLQFVRPELNIDQSRQAWAWNPIGGTGIQVSLGRVVATGDFVEETTWGGSVDTWGDSDNAWGEAA